MRENEKKVVIKLTTASILAIISLTIFSIPLLGIPSLGGILFPGNGLWKVTGEVPTAELLKIPDLNDEVTVIRDEWGIPHIYASNDLDLFFAQGFCHAQDRLAKPIVAAVDITSIPYLWHNSAQLSISGIVSRPSRAPNSTTQATSTPLDS